MLLYGEFGVLNSVAPGRRVGLLVVRPPSVLRQLWGIIINSKSKKKRQKVDVQ